jgi:hypothetical protein
LIVIGEQDLVHVFPFLVFCLKFDGSLSALQLLLLFLAKTLGGFVGTNLAARQGPLVIFEFGIVTEDAPASEALDWPCVASV